ncbi:hypothetical protein [Solibacillus daqui]|uniref:hypothetical protein n=1 Tax=Solibacillus daqui TaxID=2912187 RepID=UPI002365AD35|nr:hypothetical protein [Solibacillus daqui]
MNTSIKIQNEIEQFALTELNSYYTGEKPVHFEYVDMGLTDDHFEMIQQDNQYVIRGNSSRAILYGVYRFIEKVEGILFLDLKKQQTIEAVGIDGVYVGKPRFTRRGNVFETIDDVPFLKSMLDVGTKNGLNEVFFTFFLWDEVKDALFEDIRKRGIEVTLGGHSLRYLIAKARGLQVTGKAAADGAVNDLIGEETEFTTAHAIKNHDFLQDEQAQQQVIELIVSYCKNEPAIRRISLWPEDVGAIGEGAVQFLTRYIAFAEKVQLALQQVGLQVDVEHIVYNAGLSWEMLERKQQRVGTTDILYAYWGRDYTKSYESERDVRAWQSLEDWRQATEKSITVFEYYSDHFMLSELFPLLFKQIAVDVDRYEELGCDGMVNLVVPLHKVAKAQAHMGNYDYQQYQQLNNIVFARSLWEGLETIPHLLSESMQQFAQQIEHQLGQNSQFNAKFFPSRVVEAKNPEAKSDVIQMLTAVEQVIEQASPEAPLQHYAQALKEVVRITKERWEAL